MNKSIPLKAVLAAILGLALLAGAFVGGMTYENHRISNEFKKAFGGIEKELDTGFDDTVAGDDSEGAPVAEPVQLKRGKPHTVTTSDGGEATVTLLGSTITDASDVNGPQFTRALVLEVEVRNNSDAPVDASNVLSSHYETDEGEVLDFSGVMCDENELTVETLKPGQFSRGCSRADITDAAGKLVFADDTTTPFYVAAPAAP